MFLLRAVFSYEHDLYRALITILVRTSNPIHVRQAHVPTYTNINGTTEEGKNNRNREW